ncbi:MAG: hypothetical protein ABJL67_12705 [Sulfitobacter sp.]
MADQTETKNPPVATLKDGPISAKVWRNVSNEGKTYYNTTFGRVFTKENGEYGETRSFSQNDLLKVEKLASEAYRTVQLNRQQDKEASREAAEAEPVDMAKERDAAMQNASSQNRGDVGPERQARQYDQSEP